MKIRKSKIIHLSVFLCALEGGLFAQEESSPPTVERGPDSVEVAENGKPENAAGELDRILHREAADPEKMDTPDADSESKALDNSADESADLFSNDNEASSIFVDEPEMLAQNNPGATGGNSRTLRGFAETAWQLTFGEVRERLRGVATSDTSNEKVEILALEENKFILVKRNNIVYRYNFYKTPFQVELIKNHELKQEDYDQQEGRLFHVKVISPFIAADRVKEKIVSLHGPISRSTVDEKKGEGVDIWELEGGLIFQWHEPYKKKPYTRSVDYLSLAMAKKIMQEYAQYFDARERLLLKKILLK